MSQVAVSHKLSSNENVILELLNDIKTQLNNELPKLVLIYANTEQQLKNGLDAFKAEFANATVFGCTVSSKFSSNDESAEGISCFALAGDYKVYAGLGGNLADDTPQAIDDAILSLPTQVPGYKHLTGFIFYDAFAGVGEEIVMIISSILGKDIPLVGGAASGIDKNEKYVSSSVGLNSKILRDSFVLVLLYSKKPLGIAVNHGQEAVDKPVEVTKSEGSIVYELNNRPAWEVWKEISRDIAIKQGHNPDLLNSESEIFDYVTNYEASLASGAEKDKIRAILKVDTGTQALHFACGIPEGVMMNTSWTTEDKTMDSACKAANQAREKLHGQEIAGTLVFDCVCRKLLLKDKFIKAVNGISEELENKPLMGYEAHGQIYSNPGDLSGFHNTSTVIVSFPK